MCNSLNTVSLRRSLLCLVFEQDIIVFKSKKCCHFLHGCATKKFLFKDETFCCDIAVRYGWEPEFRDDDIRRRNFSANKIIHFSVSQAKFLLLSKHYTKRNGTNDLFIESSERSHSLTDCSSRNSKSFICFLEFQVEGRWKVSLRKEFLIKNQLWIFLYFLVTFRGFVNMWVGGWNVFGWKKWFLNFDMSQEYRVILNTQSKNVPKALLCITHKVLFKRPPPVHQTSLINCVVRSLIK